MRGVGLFGLNRYIVSFNGVKLAMGNKNYEVITECVAIKDEYMYCVAREMNII